MRGHAYLENVNFLKYSIHSVAIRPPKTKKPERGYVSSLFAVAVYLEYGHGHPRIFSRGFQG